ILGPSGSGKSTLIRLINQLESLSGGEILIDGKPTSRLSGSALRQLRSRVGFVFQQFNLYAHLTAQENITLALERVHGWEKSAAQARALALLRQVGLEEKAQQMPAQLSGGQQQRVAIARAIAVRPRVLLLDEPLSALDAQIRHNMVEEIARLHRELPELTILYVTHDQTEALTLADKIGIMKDGSLIAHGETHELYHYPPNRFSAEFLGRANILQATALKDSPEPGLVSVSCGGGLINAFSRGGLHGNNKLLCIRPQHMSLAPRSATSNRLNATLTSVHWQGDLTHLLCDVAGEAVRIVMTQVNPLPRAGDKLALYFDPGDAVLIEVQ
ncbi:ATP-binding cassette domain-containing protein, partial [Enterobacter hormaechei]|nr:ATP-binding cassette domain-containing protein [Enterobacter hormaechei]